jgi:alpha-L-arabinofuranosidase
MNRMAMLTARRSCVFFLFFVGFAGSIRAQTAQSIYGDSLGTGWQDWSWATDYLTNASPVHSGADSISVAVAAYQALYLSHDAFDASTYTNLTFWIHGGATGGQHLQVQALLNGNAQPAIALVPLTSNTWRQITLSLASLGVANKPNMTGFWIQDTSGTNQPTFYVDDIALTVPPPPAVVHLNINAAHAVRIVDSRTFGLNAAAWDGDFDTANTIGLLTNMSNQALRFPGGSLADDYDWASNTSGTNTWTWATSFDAFADAATNSHAQVYLTVNYGSGTPAQAASWVQHSNVAKHYGFKYWEIGNENYGTWETDDNTQPNDPYTYATRFQTYFNQMKAVDSTIKIGAVVTTGEDSYANYTNHPVLNPRTGQIHNGWTPVLLTTLKNLGVTPDFVIYHRYIQSPGDENDAGLLQSSTTWANDAADLRQQLNDYLGSAATNVELNCTENNSVYTNPGKQTTSLVNGLFLADSLGNVLQTEFNSVLWWDIRNGQETDNNNDPALYGWRQCGDYGITDSADPATPADRYPTYCVAKLLQYFARGGDQVVQATSDYSLLSAYAAKRTNGSLTLLVINKSSTNTLNASLSINGYLPGMNATVYSYGIPQDDAACTGIGSADISQTNFTGAANNFSYSFPAYSASVICLATPPIITGFVRNGDGSMTITWLAQSNCNYIVQNCNTLPGSWQPIGSLTNAGPTNTTLSYIDTSAASATQRFYRVDWVTP